MTDEDYGDPNDPDNPTLILYRPNWCQVLEPYSYWWYFWDCAPKAQIAEACDPSEAVIHDAQPDGGVLVTILRKRQTVKRLVYPNGYQKKD